MAKIGVVKIEVATFGKKLRWQNMAEKEKLAKPGAKRRADDVWQ